MSKQFAIACVLAAAAAFVPASAAPITWTLEQGSTSDGGLMYGNFTFDADTGIISAVDITTTAGPAFAGAHYISQINLPIGIPSALPGFGTTTGDLTDTPLLIFQLSPGMTDAGGTVTDLEGGELICGTPTCSSYSPEPLRFNRTLLVANVPEPATVPVIAAALLAMGLLFGWRRRMAG